MNNILLKYTKFINEEANASYAGEWPMNKQQVGVDDGDVANNQEFAKSENKFQEVQEYMKIILKQILQKKNANVDDNDVNKVSDSFFRLGNNKNQEIKKLVDNCKDTKQCAHDIVNKYLKYVKINFNSKDNINNVEQDSVMTSEKKSEKKIEIFSPDNRSISVTPEELDNLMKMHYVERDGEIFSFDENHYNDIQAYLGNTPEFESMINEAKRHMRKSNVEDVESVAGGVKYHNEIFPNVNVPKRYVGKGGYKWRVLAGEGRKVKPINFGDVNKKPEVISRLKRKYWDSLPYYK